SSTVPISYTLSLHDALPISSRTVPFVAKATGVPLAKLAAAAMVGRRLPPDLPDRPTLQRFAVKESVFPFRRLSGVDPILGPEMKDRKSTRLNSSHVKISYAV